MESEEVLPPADWHHKVRPMITDPDMRPLGRAAADEDAEETAAPDEECNQPWYLRYKWYIIIGLIVVVAIVVIYVYYVQRDSEEVSDKETADEPAAKTAGPVPTVPTVPTAPEVNAAELERLREMRRAQKEREEISARAQKEREEISARATVAPQNVPQNVPQNAPLKTASSVSPPVMSAVAPPVMPPVMSAVMPAVAPRVTAQSVGAAAKLVKTTEQAARPVTAAPRVALPFAELVVDAPPAHSTQGPEPFPDNVSEKIDEMDDLINSITDANDLGQ